MEVSPSGDVENGPKKGPWTPEEDRLLMDYIERNGQGSWSALPKLAGLNRCGKSCRLRWTNYLRPDIKRGNFSEEEEQLIIKLHSFLGNKWAAIATHLPGRTDNEIKNFWNTHLRKKLLQMGIDPVTHRPRTDLCFLANLPRDLLLKATSNIPLSEINDHGSSSTNLNSLLRYYFNATQVAKVQLLHNILQTTLTASHHLPSLGLPNFVGSLSLDGMSGNDLINGSSLDQQMLSSFSDFCSQASSQAPIDNNLYQQQHIQNLGAFCNGSESDQINAWSSTVSSTTHSDCIPALVPASPEEPYPSICSTSGSNLGGTDWREFLDNETSGTYWNY